MLSPSEPASRVSRTCWSRLSSARIASARWRCSGVSDHTSLRPSVASVSTEAPATVPGAGTGAGPGFASQK
eukprot:14257409-Alexandrium_andersonii.AAC.1